MNDRKTTADQQRTIITLLQEVLTKLDALCSKPPSRHPYYDTNIYGDFTWLCQLCPGIPASTLRKKSAKGLIPGYRKIGNRVMYHREQTVNWIESHGISIADMV